MSGSLHFDRNWSLSFSLFKAPVGSLPPCRIRPDVRFDRQVYLASFSKVNSNKTLGILAQAVASDDGKSVTAHNIFKKNIPTSDGVSGDNSFTQFCIDEVASKLYLFFPGEKDLQLCISSLSFGQPDRFGHRRATLSDAGHMYKIDFGGTVAAPPKTFLHPKTGEILFYVMSQNYDSFLQMNGTLDLNGARKNTIDAKILAKFNRGLHVVVIGSFRFLNKGKRLAVFNWSFENLILERSNKEIPSLPEESLVQVFSVDNGQFKFDHNLYCDQQDLIAKIYPPDSRLQFSSISNFAASVAKNMSDVDLVSKGIHFRGHVFKYTVFSCIDGAGVALMKNFHTEIESEGEMKHSFLSFKTPNLFREIQTEGKEISVHYALGSKLYYIVEIRKQATLHRLELGDHFKDYRTCAYCGTKETKKRHNDQGQRIAKFKVCRDCKKLDLHHQWWKFPCHYCSHKCMKKGWKQHKKIHRTWKF